MTNRIIRQAHPDDAAALATCIDRAYAIYATHISDLPDVSGGIADDIARNHVWVAEHAGKIVGGVIFAMRSDHALLMNIAVDPTTAGTGLGRALISVVEKTCRAGQVTKIRLSTHVDMPENLGLYQHLGWRETNRQGSKVHMEKTLDPV